MNCVISIIVPVYNVAGFLREALDSLISQTYANIEIIIVDDGSTDDSDTICNEYKKDPRVTVLHQENKGLSEARNSGLEAMTGDYVAFLDSDDALKPGAIAKILSIAKEFSPDIILHGFTSLTPEGEYISQSGFSHAGLFDLFSGDSR